MLLPSLQLVDKPLTDQPGELFLLGRTGFFQVPAVLEPPLPVGLASSPTHHSL